jgi:hypothetical protein
MRRNQIMSEFKFGDRVLVTRKAKNYENGWNNIWLEEMDNLVGKVSTVISFPLLENGGIRLENYYCYPEFVLVKVSDPITYENTAITNFHGYSVRYDKDMVHIGCKSFSKREIAALLDKFINVVNCVPVSDRTIEVKSITVEGEDVTKEEVQQILDGFSAKAEPEIKDGDTVIFKAIVARNCSPYFTIENNPGMDNLINKKAVEILAVLPKEE